MKEGLLSFKKIEEKINNKGIEKLTNDYLVSGKYSADGNTLIEGENYFALHYLNGENKKFDIIYIDPPYNTGSKDFKYNDKYVEIDDEDKHSRWLSFMDNRLSLAAKMMNKNGCLVLSIGEDEVHHIALLLRDHFNYVSEPIIWQSKASGNNNKTGNITNISTEFIFIAYNFKGFKTNEEVVKLSSNDEYSVGKVKRYPLGIVLKKDILSYPLSLYNGKSCRIIPKGEYTVDKYDEKSFKGHRFQSRTAQKEHGAYGYKMAYDDAVIKNDGLNDFLMVIDGVKDKQGLGIKFQLGNKYFQSIPANEIKVRMPNFLGYYQGGYKNFKTAKPIELIKRLIRNTGGKNASVLDFFAGTGTTMIAVDQLNKEDGGNRSCCIVTNNENNICNDFTIPRIEKEKINFNYLNIKLKL